MNKRQKKKHLKKALWLSLISIELADNYLRRYRIKETYEKKDILNENIK